MLFSQIIGHEDIKERLIQGVAKNRIAHAQLFVGPEGCGKLAMAIAYAQYINCTDKKGNDSCGECPSCKKYKSLSHPDLHFIFPTTTNKTIKKDPESDLFLNEWRDYLLSCNAYASLPDWYDHIEIENKQGAINVRDASTIMRKLNLKAFEAEYKVTIIWMAEKLNVQAANKLLKLLEEPPEKTLFILVAENPKELLQTVLSRTVPLEIPKIDSESMRRAIVRELQCDDSQANHIAKISDGNWIVATHYNEENAYFQCFQKWMRYCFKFSAPEIIDFIANEIKPLGREKQKEFYMFGLHIFHNALLLNNHAVEGLNLLEDERAFLNNFAPFVSNNNIELISRLFEESINQIERNANISLVMLDDSYKMYNYFKMK